MKGPDAVLETKEMEGIAVLFFTAAICQVSPCSQVFSATSGWHSTLEYVRGMFPSSQEHLRFQVW